MNLQNFDFICNTVDNGIIILDKELNVYLWNSWLETRTNISQKSILNQNLKKFYPSLNSKTLQRKINTALTLNSATFYNTKINHFLLEIELSKVTDRVFENMQQSVSIMPFDKEKGLVILYIYDNTQLKESSYKLEVAKEQLEEMYDEIELLLNSAMEAMLVFDDKHYINCNDVALELFEYENKKSLLNKEVYDFIDEKFQHLIEPNTQKPQEVLVRKSSGETFSALIKLQKTGLKNKHLTILSVMDISDIKAKDKLLAEQSKMAAMGEMIGNIAHQWRQPLSTISTAASGMKIQRDFGILHDSLFNEAIEGIIRSSQHLSQTIDDFKNFLKGDKEKSLFNLKKNLQTNLKIVEGMLKNETIEVVLNCDENIDIHNYPNELTQACLNLFNNSKDAFHDKMPSDASRYIFIDVKLESTNIVIDITDNALGIPEDIIGKIFEPYFTTKHKDQGTGLGLYMTHQLIVMSMQGSIKVRNKTYQYNNQTYTGASFQITLPL